MKSCHDSFLCRNKLLSICFLTGLILHGLQVSLAVAQEKSLVWTMEVGEIQAPVRIWPDEKIRVVVPINGAPKGEEVEAGLEGIRLTDRDGKSTMGEKKTVVVQRSKFDELSSRMTVVFDFDVQAIKQIKAENDSEGVLEGTWEFSVKVPRHPKEKFDKPFHESAPVKVLVSKKKLRVLLFADEPTREFQLVRTLVFARHTNKMDIFVHVRHPGSDTQFDTDHVLMEFPNQRGQEFGGQKGISMGGYDLIIAFDPDWQALRPDEIRLLENWVRNEAGRLVFVSGLKHFYQMAVPLPQLQPLQRMLPVVVKDHRLSGALSHPVKAAVSREPLHNVPPRPGNRRRIPKKDDTETLLDLPAIFWVVAIVRARAPARSPPRPRWRSGSDKPRMKRQPESLDREAPPLKAIV